MSPVQLASHVVRLAATTIRQRLVALKPPYGIDARQALQADLPIGTEVGLRLKATDRYGRTVAEVLKGATNINQALVATQMKRPLSARLLFLSTTQGGLNGDV